MIWHEKPILGIIYIYIFSFNFLYEGCVTTWSIVLLMWSHLIIHIPTDTIKAKAYSSHDTAVTTSEHLDAWHYSIIEALCDKSPGAELFM